MRSGTGTTLAVAAATLASIVAIAPMRPAEARDNTAAAVGIGLGSFALGTALGAAANPYPYNPYGYYAPAPVYYPPPPAYYPPPRTCWSPYYGSYVPC